MKWKQTPIFDFTVCVCSHYSSRKFVFIFDIDGLTVYTFVYGSAVNVNAFTWSNFILKLLWLCMGACSLGERFRLNEKNRERTNKFEFLFEHSSSRIKYFVLFCDDFESFGMIFLFKKKTFLLKLGFFSPFFRRRVDSAKNDGVGTALTWLGIVSVACLAEFFNQSTTAWTKIQIEQIDQLTKWKKKKTTP